MMHGMGWANRANTWGWRTECCGDWNKHDVSGIKHHTQATCWISRSEHIHSWRVRVELWRPDRRLIQVQLVSVTNRDATFPTLSYVRISSWGREEEREQMRDIPYYFDEYSSFYLLGIDWPSISQRFYTTVSFRLLKKSNKPEPFEYRKRCLAQDEQTATLTRTHT